MNIITGYRGVGHIYSHHDRSINVSIYGDGTYILGVGSNMAATVISANEVQIADGLVVAEGCAAEVARGTTESLTIENGSQGMLRKDLIVVQYTRDSVTGVEGMNLAVIKGVAAASNPATPSYTTGSIADGDTLVEFPLYQVNIDGISIDSVTCLVDKVSTHGSIQALQDKIGSTVMGTVATTVTGAVAEINDKRQWKLIQDADIQGGTTVQVPDGAKEIYIAVFASWETAWKVCVDFYIPTMGHLFNPTVNASITYHAKQWNFGSGPTAVYGSVQIKTTRDDSHYYAQLYSAYDKNNADVTSSTYCRMYWR